MELYPKFNKDQIAWQQFNIEIGGSKEEWN
jgi:hypothetical protein